MKIPVEKGRDKGSIPRRFVHPRVHPWWILSGWVLLLSGGVLLLGWQQGWLARSQLEGGYFALLGATLNTALLLLFFGLWMRLNRRHEHYLRCHRDLSQLRHWSGEEANLRKQGLIRELNALGAAPQELAQVSLVGADLSGVDLRDCYMEGADLHGANLQGAVLDGAVLRNANLSGSRLGLASLRGADLRKVNLENAELMKALLAGADLERGNLIDANLYGCDLRRTRIKRTRFARSQAAENALATAPHPSVEDWIREGLDAQGCYQVVCPEAKQPQR